MNPLILYFLTLLLVFGGFYLLIAHELRKSGGIKPWLMDLPTTNFRIFVSIILAIIFVVSTLLLTIVSAMKPEDVRPLPDVVLDTIGLFIFGMMGLDVASYLGKRLTHGKFRKGGGDDDVPPGSTQTMPAQGQTTVQTSGPTTVTTVPPAQNVVTEQPEGQ